MVFYLIGNLVVIIVNFVVMVVMKVFRFCVDDVVVVVVVDIWVDLCL